MAEGLGWDMEVSEGNRRGDAHSTMNRVRALEGERAAVQDRLIKLEQEVKEHK